MAVNVLFLNPPFKAKFSREQRSPAVTKSGTLYYPKWLSYAAGVAIQAGHNVNLIDAPASKKSLECIIDFIEKKNITALTCDTSTPSIYNDVSVINKIKNKFPQVKVVMVGPHVSALAEETLLLSDALDCIAIGEYEYTVLEWLAALDCGESLESISGLVWRKSKNDIRRNNPREFLKDLDDLPFVSEVYKRFLNINDYFYSHSLHPLVVFDTSRGCPHGCTFCVYPQTFSGHKMRYRSIDNVVDEFDYVAKELPQVKGIMLEDDTFIVDKKRVHHLAQRLIQKGNKISFAGNCRADASVDGGLLKDLRKAGARLFCVGFESGDDNLLGDMNKSSYNSGGNYFEKAQQFTCACKDAGILIHGCFILGGPRETKQTMQATLDFARKLKPDTAQFLPLMVYPGTEIYHQAKKDGYLKTEDFAQWLTQDGLHNAVIDFPNLSAREIVDFADYARRRFYVNGSYIVYKIKQSMSSFGELKRNVRGFLSLVKYLFKGSY
jgi:radical SAM superfamily enzyme YgiQ (UPF0313 family)